MSLTGRFFALSAALSAVVFVLPIDGLWAVMIVNAVLVLAGLLDLLLAPKTAHVGFERELPAIVALNTEQTVVWTISNREARRIHVRIADEFKPSLKALSRRADVHIPSHGQVFAETKFRPTRRGRFFINKVVVRTYGPWGLAARQRNRQVPTLLRVYPAFNSRKEAELRIQKAQTLEIGLRSVRARGTGTDFDQLREYTVDDDFRRMDWNATARTLKPIVRTYRAEQNQNVLILVDTGRVMAGRVDDVPRLEHAMDATMALATVASRLGDKVGMISFSNRIRSEVGVHQGNAQVARVTEALYDLEPELLESDYRRAFTHALMRNRRRSLVVVVTELAEQAVLETLFPALPLISQRHLVVVASVRDPDVSMWARATPIDSDKAFRKAAASSALEARKRTIAQLRSRGATVVDAAPGRLGAELADTYLQVKAAGKL